MTLSGYRFPVLALMLIAASALLFVWVFRSADTPTSGVIVSPTRIADTARNRGVESPEQNAIGAEPVTPGETHKPVSRTPDQLAGRVVDDNGVGLAGINIRLRTQGGDGENFILRQITTDSNGRFELVQLDPQGVYILFVDATEEYSGYRRDGFTLDKLPGPLEIELARPSFVNIEGTVVDVEHLPVANFTFTLENLDLKYPSKTLSTDSAGNFRIAEFPAGALKIYTASADYYRILGLWVLPEAYSSLLLVLDRGRYSLAGRVYDDSGVPIANARVTLDSEIIAIEYRSHAFRESRTDASGVFEFSGLGGVGHTLGVYTNGYKSHIQQHAFQSYSDYLEIRLRR